MPTSSSDRSKVEQYARTLLDAAKSEGRAYSDIVQWSHAANFSPEVLEALSALHAEDNPRLIGKVYERLQSLANAYDSTVVVTATTAVEMDDDLREKVVDKMHEVYNAPIFLVEQVDPGILGGIVLEAQGQRYDASVRAQLANVRTSLSSTFAGGEQ